MRYLTAIVTLIAICLVLSACAPREVLEVDCTEFLENNHLSGNLEVAVGDEFSMNLCSNTTTGFSWSEQADISDKEAVEQVEHAFVGPGDKDQPPPPGKPGEEVWTFRALKRGESTIYVEYSRQWEDGEKAEWTFMLTVVVE